MDTGPTRFPLLSQARVLVTGATGFVGSWLCLRLEHLGVPAHGLSRRTAPHGLFAALGLDRAIPLATADLERPRALATAVRAAAPDLVIHLASQAHTARAASRPGPTFSSNVMGLVRLLDACLDLERAPSVIAASSDRCYAPGPAGRLLAENAPLGGAEPYGASKAAAEMALRGYSRSFARREAGLASVRCCNLVGGGDHTRGRLVPDCLADLAEGRAPQLKSPGALRPWMHVFDAVDGYLRLAEALLRDPVTAAGPLNVGARPENVRSVQEFANALARHWGGPGPAPAAPPAAEAPVLLDCSRAAALLGWRPRWDADQTAAATAAWARSEAQGNNLREVSLRQLETYLRPGAGNA